MEENGLKKFLKGKNGIIVLTVFICAVSLLGMALLGALTDYIPHSQIAEGIITIISCILFVFWIVCGWKALTFITPNVFLIMPLVGWIIYFVAKGFLSLISGVFVAPYYIAKAIIKIL